MHRYLHVGDWSDPYFVCGYFGLLDFSDFAIGMYTTWYYPLDGALTCQSSHYLAPTVMTDCDLEKSRKRTASKDP